MSVLALRQLLALAALAILSALWGRRAMARLLDALPPVEALAFSIAAGLGALGTALFLLGLVGGLAPLPIGALAALSALLLWRPRRAPAASSAAAPARRSPLSLGTVAGVGALLVLPAFVLSLYPPTAFDEVTYHLPLAAAFVRAHRLVVVPQALFPVSPQLLEVLFAAQLMAWGDVATHTVQLLCMGTTAAALFAAGERYAGPRAGAVAAALWLANPLVQYEAASAYVDLGLTLFCLLAVLAWEHWHDTGARRWLAAAGAFVGFAAAAKHLGLLWLGLLALATWYAAPRRRKAATTGLYLAGACAVLLPWVLRSLVLTGNPIFPLLPDWFPSVGSRLERSAGVPLAHAWLGTSRYAAQLLSPRRQLPALLTLPWRVVFDRAAIHHQAPFAPYVLAVLPLVAWWAWRDRRLRRWLLWIVAYAALGTAADPRFQLPNAALLALAGGISVARTLDHPRVAEWARWSRPASSAALVLALAAPGPLYAAYKVWRHGPLPVSAAAREAFLLRELPGYRAIQLLNQRCGANYTVFAFDAENLTYYARGRFLGQRSGPFAQRPLAPLLQDSGRLYAALRRFRVDDLLVNHPPTAAGRGPSPGPSPREEASFLPWFQPLLAPPDPELFALRGDGRPPGSPCAPAPPAARHATALATSSSERAILPTL